MKKSNLLKFFTLAFISLALSSCAVIGGIFKAGVGVGVFIVVAIIALVIFLIVRLGKNK